MMEHAVENGRLGAEGRKFIEEARKFEESSLREREKKIRIAWAMTAIFGALAALAIVALILLMPLKQTVPYVLKVDQSTGYVDVMTSLGTKDMKYNEAVDKFNLAQYVRARESYDWENIKDFYGAVQLMSAPDVWNEYSEFYRSDISPVKTLKKNVTVQVNIKSITFVGDTAQVRFEKIVRQRNQSASQAQRARLIATIGYDYVTAPMKEEDRLVNPLGFQVFHYRVDQETS